MDREELKIIKIGLDIDRTLDVQPTHNKIKCYYGKLVERYIVYISAGGKGLHFELYLNKPVTISQSFKIRDELGDDPKRLAFSKADLIRGWDFDILFTYKKVLDENYNYVWRRRKFFEEVIL
jgi:hypothetical protein